MCNVSGSSGWLAQIALRYELRRGLTRLTQRRQFGPLMVQRPFYPEAHVAHTYLLHPPGGVVGGDKLDIRIDVEREAHALVTSPGATKFYRSNGQQSTQTLQLFVQPEGFLEWLPQEAIFFPQAQAVLSTQLHLAATSRFIGWEMYCFGRPVLNEHFLQGQVKGQLRCYIDERLVLAESLLVDGSQTQAACMREFPMSGSLYIYPLDEPLLHLLRQALAERSQTSSAPLEFGITDLDGLGILRVLGHQTESVMACFIQAWQTTRLYWLGQLPQVPRIWST